MKDNTGHVWVRHTVERVSVTEGIDGAPIVHLYGGEKRQVIGCENCDGELSEVWHHPCLAKMVDDAFKHPAGG